MAVHQPLRGLKRLCVALGFDGLERLDPVFTIDEIGAICRHDALHRDNAAAWNHNSIGPCGNRWNPNHNVGDRIETIEQPDYYKLLRDTVGTMNIEDLTAQAERCRRLAKGADPFTAKRLLDLATEYEARITEIEKGYRPSEATRSLKGEL
jgi:hypothetical protein